MKSFSKSIFYLIFSMIIALTLNLAHAQDPEDWEEQDATLVGRISHLEGQLFHYNPDTDDWEATSQEAPFGLDDLLYAETDVKAEIIMPNNTWIRLGGETRLQLVNLKPDVTELDIAFGKARLYNKSAKTRIKATTPFGTITAPPGSTVDLSVNEKGVDIIAIKKKVYFIHNTSSDKHEIRSNSTAISAEINAVTAVPGKVEHAWKKWNQEMDALWATRMRDNGASAAHLPSELHTEAYPLDQHGVWEKVYYDGAHYRFWRPVRVSAGWAPFTAGAWTVWHGDHVWIPHEPFGYVTHHYGNWIFTAGFWYWAPPVTRVMVRAHVPHLRIGFGWYPGRVAWIHHGAHLGWIPLAPREPYYCHRHWGRRSIVITSGKRYRHRTHKYRHHKHAVVIHRSHLYRSGSYKRTRIKSIPHNTIRENYRTTPVLSRAVIKDHASMKKNKNRFRPAHRAHLSGHANKHLNKNPRGRLSKPTTRQRHRENAKIRRQNGSPQIGHTPKDRKQRGLDKTKANSTKADLKNRKNRSTAVKDHQNSSRGEQSRASKKIRQPRKRENIVKNRDVTPSKTHPKKSRSGRIDVEKRRIPMMNPKPIRNQGIKENRSNQKKTTVSPPRDSTRRNSSKAKKIQRNNSKGKPSQGNERAQRQQKNDQYSSSQPNTKRPRYQSVPSNPRPNRGGKPTTYNRQPTSRTDTSVKRVERQTQPDQRKIRQQHYRPQSATNSGVNSSRHRKSSSGGNRQRNRN